jgi:membrane-bound ClpP family serine protease
MTPIIWAALLLFFGIALVFIEVFVPSGGALACLSVVSVLAAVVMAFYYGGPVAGTIFLAIATFALPSVIALAVHWWPNTPLGRLILIRPSRDSGAALGEKDERRGLKSLIGKRGKAKSKMLPSGVVTIEGKTYDAIGEGTAIEPGQTIQVIAVRAHRIVVRLVDGDAPAPPPPDHKDHKPDDILAQPIDALGLEPLDPLS